MNKNEYNNQSYSNFDYRDYIKMAKFASNNKERQQSKSNQSKFDLNNYQKMPDRKPNFYKYEELKQRYLKLQNDYYDMMQKAQQKKLDHMSLKTEVKSYEKYEQKDEAEIQRLTYLIDLYKKNRHQKQMDDLDIDFGNKISRINKFDQSTEDQIKLKSSGEMFRSRIKQQSNKKTDNSYKKQEKSLSKHKIVQHQNQQRDKYKYESKNKNLAYFQKQKYEETKISKKINNPSYSRLRFIPQNQFK